MVTQKIWIKQDCLAGAIAALVAGAVYVWTAAPNVTLLDSGEFIVAAQHFGVPHPPGYPLWTFLVWLFQLLPIANAAREVALFSAVCGALAVGLCAMLFSSSARWMLGDKISAWPGLSFSVSVGCALLLAFSFSMWSQATIAEVYTLHALLVGMFLSAIYVWLRRTDSLFLLLLSFFLLALSFSNHQLSVALAPLPLLAVLLARREWFWDLIVACAMAVLLVYLGFAILSGEPPILKTATRFFYCVMTGFAVLVTVKRSKVEWRMIAYLPFAVVLGILPYAYMPIASSTNPPMNWAYTSTPDGFYYSFNRSQYGGSLSKQSLRSLGKLVGTYAGNALVEESDSTASPKQSSWQTLNEWISFFWLQLARSFTPLAIVAYFLALVAVLKIQELAARTWIYVLEIGYVLAAILQPVADGAQNDNAGWWLQMPYHTYTNLFFALLAGLGFCVGLLWIIAKSPRLAWLRFGILLLPLWPLYLNYDGCTQRGRWFGWQFGHDMLNDLPKGSVVLGGTDPGRFVPTYMILGESPQPPGLKRDLPNFDRRDLYIITQNGVGEPLYRKYLADHYGTTRPAPANRFERWLGREHIYPEKTLTFPTEEEIKNAVSMEMDKDISQSLIDPTLPHSVVTRLIWEEKNRDAHEFFVEESFPLTWSYDHAEPYGLIYKIHRERLQEISPESVRRDFNFWEDYSEKLLSDPDFKKDFDAQRSFSKLRTTAGNIYRHRKMYTEAERAYRQSIRLWSGSESISGLTAILWEREDFEGVMKIAKNALDEDPNNVALWRLYFSAEKRKETQSEIAEFLSKLKSNPSDADSAEKLLRLYGSIGDTNNLPEFLSQTVRNFPKNSHLLSLAANCASEAGFKKEAFSATEALVAADPSKALNHLSLASAAIKCGDTNKCIQSANEAIRLGGLPMRDSLSRLPDFKEVAENPAFKKLIGN